jgi:hypothetical protein
MGRILIECWIECWAAKVHRLALVRRDGRQLFGCGFLKIRRTAAEYIATLWPYQRQIPGFPRASAMPSIDGANAPPLMLYPFVAAMGDGRP